MKIKGFSSSPISPKSGSSLDAPKSPTQTLTAPKADLLPTNKPGGFSPGASSFSPRTVNPHLANPSLAGQMRPQISQQAQQNPSFYGSLVGGVNNALQRTGFGISPASHHSVMNNLQQVSSGQMSQGTAHFNEAGTFAQDAFQSFRHGKVGQGMMESFGAGVNTFGGTGMSLLQGLSSPKLSTPTPAELSGNSPW
ncbi:hypothetical protein [Archangium primigenium]|uniref:hypothetical protein n=1 Tax=[Archangium] primigenium TaxID=2792470 RepID=UPI00195917AE|nr:hypothetical protein [Archangium primigenium]MBM7119410.1 hypothetical protein [Archangium primigenium]